MHRGRWRDDRGTLVDVAVKVQYPGVAKALRSDLRTARLVGRVMARLTGLDIGGLTEELAARIVDELDYVREGQVQREVAPRSPVRSRRRWPPRARTGARAGRPHQRRRSLGIRRDPRVLITTWLDGVPLSALSTRPSPSCRPAGATWATTTRPISPAG